MDDVLFRRAVLELIDKTVDAVHWRDSAESDVDYTARVVYTTPIVEDFRRIVRDYVQKGE